jgi:hypothetical protein
VFSQVVLLSSEGRRCAVFACARPLSRFAVHAALVPPHAHAIHSSTGPRYDYSYEIAAAVALSPSGTRCESGRDALKSATLMFWDHHGVHRVARAG